MRGSQATLIRPTSHSTWSSSYAKVARCLHQAILRSLETSSDGFEKPLPILLRRNRH